MKSQISANKQEHAAEGKESPVQFEGGEKE